MTVLCFLFATHSPAQNRNTAELTGTVSDSTGAVLPLVEVTVRNMATQIVVSAKTNNAGNYVVPLLPPGHYAVTYSRRDFQTLERPDVDLELDQTARIDISMSVGQPQQVVVVSGESPLLATDSSQVETVFSSELTHELPLVGRTPVQLAVLAPGTTTVQSDAIGVGSGGVIDPGRVNVSGGRTFTISALLNGGSVVLPNSNNFGNMIPSLDAISEFSVIQNNFGAQYGNGTSVLNMVIKSGTSAFHGSVYEFLENDALNAKSGFATTKQALRYNQFGGSVGGPILRNRVFFFFSLQNTLSPSSSFSVVTVPTAAEAAGDFSAFLTANANDNSQPVLIYDPTTALPFAGNKIPSDRIDSVAKAVLAYWPAPNYGSTGATANNYGKLVPSNPKTPIYNARGDWTVSPAHQLSVSLHAEPYSSQNTGDIPGPACYGSESCGSSVTFDQAYQVAEKWLINSHMINGLYAGYIREHYANKSPTENKDYPSKLGLSANGISQVYFPSFSFSGVVPTSLGPGGYYEGFQNIYTYSDALSWEIGKHNLSLGGQFSAAEFNDPAYYGSPQFNFNGQFTAGPAALQGTGIGFADFLLGDVQSYNYNATPIEFGGRRKSVAAYIQDDWKVTPTLTLNLGLRYQYESTWSEAHNNLANFSPTAINPATNLPGAIVYVTSGNPYIQQNHPRLFAPRVGFAQAIGRSTVVRGGFGIFYHPLGAGTNFNSGPPGYNITQTLVSQTRTSPPVFQLQNGPPAYTVPTAADRNGAVANGQAINWWPQDAPQTYQEEWHTSIQRQVGAHSTAEISYVGSRGLHLYFPRDADQVPLGDIGSAVDMTNPQSLRPFPVYQGISTVYDDSSSNYNALEVILQRRFADGFTLLTDYTYARSFDTSSTDQTTGVGSEWQVAADTKLNYAVSEFNQNHRGVVAYVWEVPVGQGKKLLNQGGIADAILGGWTNSGSFVAHSGNPFTAFGSGTQTTGLLAGSIYANCNGSSSGPRTSTEWFNTSAFSDPANYTIGTCRRDSVLGPGGWDFDSAVMKDFKLWESVKFQFRADAFNVFNHRWLSLPNSTIGSGAFGEITKSSPARILEVGAHISF